jgi:septum formation protein
VLAADTLVFLGDEIFGKPIDAAEARRMLRVLAGRVHSVVTGVALLSGGILRQRTVVSRVLFAAMTNDEIAWYVATGEPMDKAGAYALQGAGSRFVEAIEGSPSNVIGLPVRAVYELLQDAGLAYLALPPAAGGRK